MPPLDRGSDLPEPVERLERTGLEDQEARLVAVRQPPDPAPGEDPPRALDRSQLEEGGAVECPGALERRHLVDQAPVAVGAQDYPNAGRAQEPDVGRHRPHRVREPLGRAMADQGRHHRHAAARRILGVGPGERLERQVGQLVDPRRDRGAEVRCGRDVGGDPEAGAAGSLDHGGQERRVEAPLAVEGWIPGPGRVLLGMLQVDLDEIGLAGGDRRPEPGQLRRVGHGVVGLPGHLLLRPADLSGDPVVDLDRVAAGRGQAAIGERRVDALRPVHDRARGIGEAGDAVGVRDVEDAGGEEASGVLGGLGPAHGVGVGVPQRRDDVAPAEVDHSAHRAVVAIPQEAVDRVEGRAHEGAVAEPETVVVAHHAVGAGRRRRRETADEEEGAAEQAGAEPKRKRKRTGHGRVS